MNLAAEIDEQRLHQAVVDGLITGSLIPFDRYLLDVMKGEGMATSKGEKLAASAAAAASVDRDTVRACLAKVHGEAAANGWEEALKGRIVAALESLLD